MKYDEFSKLVEPLTVPTEEQKKIFLKSAKSSHFCLRWHIGGVPSDEQLQLFVDTIQMIEDRGGEREKDFIVIAGSLDHLNGEFFTVQLHTVGGFISDEDFPSYVERK